MKPIYDTPLPKGWRESELRNVTVRKRGYSWSKDQEINQPADGTIPVIRIPNVNEHLSLDDLLHLRDVPEDARKESGVTKDWILFVASNGNPARIGDSVLMTEDREMVFASFLQAIASKDSEIVTPEFLASWLRIHNVHESFSRTSQQTTGLANFSWSAVKKLPVRFPDRVQEQRQVMAVFAATDEAINAVRDQIIAARRLKTALMQQLFTKGIPGRHNGFQSITLGRKEYRIPASWRLRQIKDVLSEPLVNGVSPQSRPDPPGFPILNVSCISDGLCNPALSTYVDVDAETFRTYLARKGDFFVLRGNGNIDYVASGGLLREEPSQPSMFSDLLIRLRFNADVAEHFVAWMWQSNAFLHRLQSKAKSGSGLWKIGLRDIRREAILLPPRDEQEMIVEALEASHQSLDALQCKIDALLRLKKSLLQNLLTGKVRVKPESRRG